MDDDADRYDDGDDDDADRYDDGDDDDDDDDNNRITTTNVEGRRTCKVAVCMYCTCIAHESTDGQRKTR